LQEGANTQRLESPSTELTDLFPSAINAKGQIVGVLKSPQDLRFSRAFVWKEGKIEEIGTLGGKFSSARSLNDKGQVVGGATTAQEQYQAFLWSGGKMTGLGTLPGGDFSTAQSINEQGWIVGVSNTGKNGKNRAFLWKEGKMTSLGILPGGTLSHAHAINDAGDIVGWADTAEIEMEAILWRKGKMIKLGSLGEEPSSAWGINNRGQIVGTASTDKKRMHAFLWENGKMTDLNTLIPKEMGWVLQFAYRINERGQILGSGLFRNSRRLFLLTPTRQQAQYSSRYCYAPQKTSPKLNQITPDFTLKDIQNRAHTLSTYKGKSVVLFFFCGCAWCRECARLWADIQKSHSLDIKEPPKPLTTLVVFQGEGSAAKEFLTSTGLDAKQTTLLPDKPMKAILPYRALPCPRVFVLNGERKLLYTNSSPDDAPQKGTATTILSRTIDAYQRLQYASLPQDPLPPSHATLRLLPSRGVDKVNEQALRYRVGEIDPYQKPLIKQNFRLFNAGKTAVPIALQTTCGCTSTLLSANGKAVTALPAGKEGIVSVTLHTDRIKPGIFSKYIYVLTGDDPAPIASFEIQGSVVELVRFEPTVLDFGKIQAGKGSSVPLVAHIDTRFKGIKLQTNNPDIEIVPTSKPKEQSRVGERVFESITYSVSLRSNASIGEVKGEVYYLPITPPNPKPKGEALPRDIEPLGGVRTTLAGEVEGSISANPRVIVSGSVERGKPFLREVELNSKNSEVLRYLKATSSTPYIGVSIHSSITEDGVPHRTLAISVSEKAPAGALNAKVTIITKQGERLVIPVLLNIFNVGR
jgi:probable HAF family extracellular repeat protein